MKNARWAYIINAAPRFPVPGRSVARRPGRLLPWVASGCVERCWVRTPPLPGAQKARPHTYTHTHIYIYIYIYTQSTSIHIYIYIHMMTAMYIRYMKINMILHYITSHYEGLYIHILAAYTVYYAPQWIGDASGQWRWGTTWVWKSGFQVLSPTHLCMRVSLFPVSQICWWETGEYTFPAHSDK